MFYVQEMSLITGHLIQQDKKIVTTKSFINLKGQEEFDNKGHNYLKFANEASTIDWSENYPDINTLPKQT